MRFGIKATRFISCCMVFGILFTACISGRLQPAPGSRTDPPFLPPTQLPTPIPPTPTPAREVTKKNGGSGCVDNLKFVSDVTIPDGTLVDPGSKIDKRWEVENNGTCNWDNRYKLKLIAGDDMGSAHEQALYPLRAGNQTEIQIQFTAPTTSGLYSCKWQAFDPSGNPFGEWISIQIVVK